MFTHVLDAFVPIKDFVEFLCIKVMSILVIFHEISESEISDHPVAVSGRQAELFLELIVNSYTFLESLRGGVRGRLSCISSIMRISLLPLLVRMEQKGFYLFSL